MEAHKLSWHAKQFGEHTWLNSWADKEPARDNLRRCSYCGSVHPGDLLEPLKNGARLDAADRKYGWPHKFYVHGVPNELAGQTVRVGSSSGPVRNFYTGELNIEAPTPEELASGRYDRPIMGTASSEAVVKFYNEHLVDAGDCFEELQVLIARQTGILFEIKEDGALHFRRAA